MPLGHPVGIGVDTPGPLGDSLGKQPPWAPEQAWSQESRLPGAPGGSISLWGWVEPEERQSRCLSGPDLSESFHISSVQVVCWALGTHR